MWVKRALLGMLAVSVAGCLRTTQFTCESDPECATGGICEAVGYCSFADPNCGSGRRFGELSGIHANQCVSNTAVDAALDQSASAAFCDAAAEPALVGCWALEGTLDDASGDANHGTGTNVAYGQGRIGMAAMLAANSRIAVADSASLTAPAITIEAWIHPTMIPTGTARMGIVDNNGQYGFFVTSNGLSCVNNASAAVTLAANQWTHVACTYDGANAVIYVAGAAVTMNGGGGPLGAGDTAGTVLGGNSPTGDTLVGMIDQVRIWNVARTVRQVCAAAEACP